MDAYAHLWPTEDGNFTIYLKGDGPGWVKTIPNDGVISFEVYVIDFSRRACETAGFWVSLLESTTPHGSGPLVLYLHGRPDCPPHYQTWSFDRLSAWCGAIIKCYLSFIAAAQLAVRKRTSNRHWANRHCLRAPFGRGRG